MTSEQLYQVCLRAAKTIVAKERELYPNSEGIVAFEVQAGGSNTDTSFQRQGTSTQEKQYNLPAALAGLIEQGYMNGAVPSELASAEQQFLQGLLQMVPEALPNLAVLNNNANLNPTSFTGSGTLNAIAGQNPYSKDWENQTQGLYERTYDIARANAASGPEKVRGGQARAGFEMADTNAQASLGRFAAVKGEQQKEAGVVGDAIATANAIETARRGTALHSQGQQVAGENARRQQVMGGSGHLSQLRANDLGQKAMGAEFLARPKMQTSDDMRGKGNQSSFNWGAGAGLSCCFIFIAATGGELPWWVRYCRNHLGTDETRRGYIRMAAKLVPWMYRWRIVKTLVEAIMTYPLTCYGGFLLCQPGYEGGYVFRPVKRFWFAVWNYLGKA